MVLSVVAKIRVKDGQQAEFETVASQLAKAVQANEPGCLLYSLNKGDTPTEYVFLERYTNEDAVKAHRASEHFRTLGRAMGAHMDGPPEVLRFVEIA